MNLTGAAGLFLQALQQEGQQALAEYLTQQRWFAGKARSIDAARCRMAR